MLFTKIVLIYVVLNSIFTLWAPFNILKDTWWREKMKARVKVELVKCTYTCVPLHAYWPTLDRNKRIALHNIAYYMVMLSCTVFHTWHDSGTHSYSSFFFPLVYLLLPFIAIIFIHLVYSFLRRRCKLQPKQCVKLDDNRP